MVIDVERARRDTPATAELLHFNNAGAALPPAPVIDSVVAHLRREAEIGPYEAADEAATAAERAYGALAQMLGCNTDEIALLESATRAWDAAFYSLRFAPGDRILTGRVEYASNVLAFLQTMMRTGAQIEVVPDDEHGQIDVAALARLMDDRVRLIALTHVATNGGLVNPAAKVGAIARAAGVPFLLDACQSAGQMPLNVDEIGCDMLSATGRKYLRGPRGTGFLYVRRNWIERLEPPCIDLHAATWTKTANFEIRPDAKRFECWESSLAGRIGLGVAVDYALGWGLAPIRARVEALAARLRTALADVRGVTVHDKGEIRCGIVTFSSRDEAPTALQQRLRRQRINISVTVREATRYDMDARGLDSLARASVHYYNTEEEITRFCEAIAGRA